MSKSLYAVTTYTLTHIGLIFFLYPQNIILSTKEAFWIPIVIGIFSHILLLFLYVYGLDFFPNEDIFRIYSRLGKWFGLIFLFPLVLTYIFGLVISLKASSQLISIIFLAKTPQWSIIFLLILISGYLSYMDSDNIFRTSLLLGIIFFPIIFFVLVVSFQNVDWHHIHPLWNKDFSFFKTISFRKSFLPLSGSFIFLGFVQPYFTFDKKKILITSISIIPFYFIAVYLPILTFGHSTASRLINPFIFLVDTVNISWLMFDRITLFFLTCLIIFIMLYISLLLWMIVRISHHYFPFLKPKALVIGVSGLIFLLSFFINTWGLFSVAFNLYMNIKIFVIPSIPLSILYVAIKKRKELKVAKT